GSNMIYVRVTDKEAMAYQKAVNTGTLYAVKVEDNETENTLSSGSETSSRNVVSDSEKSQKTYASYEVKSGDTASSIAEHFMTTEDKLGELNDGDLNFKQGDIIKVPGN